MADDRPGPSRPARAADVFRPLSDLRRSCPEKFAACPRRAPVTSHGVGEMSINSMQCTAVSGSPAAAMSIARGAVAIEAILHSDRDQLKPRSVYQPRPNPMPTPTEGPPQPP